MADLERKRAQTAARVRKYRQRQAEQAEIAAEVLQRRAAAAADRLERDHPEAARVLAELPADVAGAVVAELNRRAFERAVQRAESLPCRT